jgi:hypothetical protein
MDITTTRRRRVASTERENHIEVGGEGNGMKRSKKECVVPETPRKKNKVMEVMVMEERDGNRMDVEDTSSDSSEEVEESPKKRTSSLTFALVSNAHPNS